MLEMGLSPYVQGGVAGASAMASVWLLSIYAKETAQEPVPCIPFKMPYLEDDDGGGE